MQKEYLSYLPPIFGEINEFRALAKVTDEFIRRAYRDIQKMVEGFFIATAKSEWLARHEKLYGVMPRDSETEEERRFRLFTMTSGELPYTMKNLKRKLSVLCGENNFTVTADAASCSLNITLSIDSDDRAKLVIDMIRRITPANLSLTVTRK